MLFSTGTLRHVAVGFFGLFYLTSWVYAADTKYCSTFNTADTNRNSSIYQSNGLCSIFCDQNYAFAVLQYDACWCSDYIPKTSTTGCTRNCPGFPTEKCGGFDLYGYIELEKEPAGTKGPDTPSTTSTQQAITTVTASPDPVTTTIVISPPIFTSIWEMSPSSSTTLISSTRASSDSTSTTSKSSSTWTPTQIVSLVTGEGSVRTITVLSTQPPATEAANNQSSDRGLGAGAIAGLSVGIFALAAIIGIIIFLVLRRRNQKKEADAATAAALSAKSLASTGQEQAIPSRTMSENSRYVLGTDGRQVVEAWESDNREVAGSRTSRLMPVDPRLNPFSGVYQRGENKSRESVNTIRDDHDYSRRVHHGNGPLRAVNPDTTNLDD